VNYFIESGISKVLANILKNSKDEYSKTEVLKFLFDVTSSECITELNKVKIPSILTNELTQSTDLIVLDVIKKILKSESLEGIEVDKQVLIESLSICIESGKKLIRTPALICVCISLPQINELPVSLLSILTNLYGRK
jgi:hypothetical protein